MQVSTQNLINNIEPNSWITFYLTNECEPATLNCNLAILDIQNSGFKTYQAVSVCWVDNSCPFINFTIRFVTYGSHIGFQAVGMVLGVIHRVS